LGVVVLPWPQVHLLAKVLYQLVDRMVVMMVVVVVVFSMLAVTILVGRVLLLLLVDAEALGEGRVVEALAIEGSVAHSAVCAVHRLA